MSLRIAALLLLATVSGVPVASAATMLQQDFSSSTTLSSYISASPGIGQWNQIATLDPATITITGDRLSFNRAGSRTMTFSRTTDFSPAPAAMIYKFDLSVTAASIGGSDNTLRVGSGFGTGNSDESDANTYGKLGIRITTNAPGGFYLRDIIGGAASVIYSGSQAITWVLNNSGGTLTYLAPDGTVHPVSNDKMDVWVGATAVFDEIDATTTTQSMTDLKFYFNSGSTSTITFDNFDLRSFGALALSETHNDVSCNGAGDGSITATFSGGTAPYQARLDAGAFGAATSPESFAGVAPGTHAVTVVDADGAAASLTGIAIADPAALALTLGKTDVTCVGSGNGTITATYSGGTPPYTIELDGGGFASGTSPTTFTNVGTGTHTVIVQDANNCQISQPVTVDLVLTSHSIAASAGAGGSISPSGSLPVVCGTDQAFTITPDACYSIADVLVDGVSVGAVSGYTFTNVQASHTIEASFTFDTFTIAASAGAGGSISPSGSVPVNCGADQAFAILPDACYVIADVRVDGISVGAVSAHTFTDVQAAHTIEASFTLETFPIAATAGTGGSISPSGSVAVDCGADQAFTITAGACYVIADVLVDGVSVGAVSAYTFSNVQDAHTIEASFTITTFPVTASAGGGGSINPSGSVVLNCGADQTFLITPNAGYSIADVLVDGNSVGPVSDYTFTDVQAARSIAATFVDNTGPIVQVTAPNGGGNWNLGDIQNVLWTATDGNGVASVDVHVSRDNGATWEPIATAMANTGWYDWPVTGPGTNSAGEQTFTALIRITARDNASNVASDQSDVAFSIFDIAVETLVAEFTASTTGSGIEIHWQLSSTGRLSSVKLERSEFETGPWMAVDVESRLESGRTVALDRSVVPGRKYWYRLVATSGSGQVDVFGPVSGETEAVTAFAITRVTPNPSRGPFHVEFAVAREASVRLSLVDIQGREMSVLAEGSYRPGRYTAAWAPGRVATPSGVYFVRYQVDGRQWFRRVVIGR